MQTIESETPYDTDKLRNHLASLETDGQRGGPVPIEVFDELIKKAELKVDLLDNPYAEMAIESLALITQEHHFSNKRIIVLPNKLLFKLIELTEDDNDYRATVTPIKQEYSTDMKLTSLQSA